MGDIIASDNVVKHSGDNRVYTFDCRELLADGETVTGTPTVTHTTEHATSTLTIGTPAVNTTSVTVDGATIGVGQAVQVRISGGTSMADHTLECTIATSGSNTVVTKGIMKVRDN